MAVKDGKNGSPCIAVLGGGIAGITAALSLAQSGSSVELIEKEFSLGGHAYRFACKAAETCNKCSVCLINEQLRELMQNRRIAIHTGSSVAAATQRENGWELEMTTRPRRVNRQLCISCGLCEDVCPTEPKSISLPQQGAVPPVFFIHADTCLSLKGQDCRKCESICPAKAVNLNEPPATRKIEADAVVIATGYTPFDAGGKPQYGYGKFPNVVTGIELEEQLRYWGQPLKPADGLRPRRIAFIQCVGSRETRVGNRYCSQVCCMYASRLASSIKSNWPDTEITIFYMDLQSFGKGFSEFISRESKRINFIREMPGSIELNPATGDLSIRVEEGGGSIAEFAFDMAVLSVGMMPGSETKKLAEMLGIGIDDHGFLKPVDSFNLAATSSSRIFLAGSCHGPMDIAESIAQAKNCAEKVMVLLGER